MRLHVNYKLLSLRCVTPTLQAPLDTLIETSKIFIIEKLNSSNTYRYRSFKKYEHIRIFSFLTCLKKLKFVDFFEKI